MLAHMNAWAHSAGVLSQAHKCPIRSLAYTKGLHVVRCHALRRPCDRRAKGRGRRVTVDTPGARRPPSVLPCFAAPPLTSPPIPDQPRESARVVQGSGRLRSGNRCLRAAVLRQAVRASLHSHAVCVQHATAQACREGRAYPARRSTPRTTASASPQPAPRCSTCRRSNAPRVSAQAKPRAAHAQLSGFPTHPDPLMSGRIPW